MTSQWCNHSDHCCNHSAHFITIVSSSFINPLDKNCKINSQLSNETRHIFHHINEYTFCILISMYDKSRNTWLCVHWQWNTLEWCQLNALQASHVVHLVTPLSCVSLPMNTQPCVPAIESALFIHDKILVDNKILHDSIMNRSCSIFINMTYQSILVKRKVSRDFMMDYIIKRTCNYPLFGIYFQEEERVRLMCQGHNAVRKLRNDYNQLLETYNVLIMPTIPRVAEKLPPEGESIKGRCATLLNHLRREIAIVANQLD